MKRMISQFLAAVVLCVFTQSHSAIAQNNYATYSEVASQSSVMISEKDQSRLDQVFVVQSDSIYQFWYCYHGGQCENLINFTQDQLQESAQKLWLQYVGKGARATLAGVGAFIATVVVILLVALPFVAVAAWASAAAGAGWFVPAVLTGVGTIGGSIAITGSAKRLRPFSLRRAATVVSKVKKGEVAALEVRDILDFKQILLSLK